MSCRRVLLIGGLLLMSTAGAEEIVLHGTSIKAMEGLPAVSFVVPWQSLQPPPYITMAQDSVVDESLHLVDAALLPVTPQQSHVEWITKHPDQSH